MSMSTIQFVVIHVVAMHAGHGEEQSGSSLPLLALGVVALVVAAMLALRARLRGGGATLRAGRSGRGAS